jgi:hypothetical protein
MTAGLSLPLSGCSVLPNGQNASGTFGAVNSNEMPTISQDEDGEWNAHFSSYSCEVHCSQDGIRTQMMPPCNNTQILKAEAGMAPTRRE